MTEFSVARMEHTRLIDLFDSAIEDDDFDNALLYMERARVELDILKAQAGAWKREVS